MSAVFTIALLFDPFPTAPTSLQDKTSLRIDELMAGIQERCERFVVVSLDITGYKRERCKYTLFGSHRRWEPNMANKVNAWAAI